MKFYHCFYTDLPDQFVEANAAALIKWADGWQDKNRYYHRQRVIDTVVIDFFGNAKKEDWPRLMVQSKVLLERWTQNKGANYNGGYWESLAEDQRDPDRKPGLSGGKDALLTSWFSSPSAVIAGQGAGLTATQIQQMYQQAANAMRHQSLAALMGHRNAVWYGTDWAEPPRPALKREGVVAGEIVGYRCWKIEKGLLRSVYQKDTWLPGQVLEGRELGDWDSRGIHAWKDKGSKQYLNYIRSYLNQEQEQRSLYIYPSGDMPDAVLRPAMVTGTVFLWGDVVEHERGWRAEFARVRSLDWLYPDDTMMGREQETLADLRSSYSVTSNLPPHQRE